MRLESLTGFELRGPIPCNLSEEALSLGKYRLVLFTPEQANPVYISEEFPGHASGRVSLNEFSFKGHFCRRSYRIALQLWAFITTWQMVESWSVDLRQAKFVSSKKNLAAKGLTILADTGLFHLPFPDSTETRKRESHPLANTIEDVQADAAASDDKSLMSRWFSWPKIPLSGSISQAGSNSLKTSLSYPALVDLWTLQRSLDEARVASVEMADQADEAISSSSLFANEKVFVLRKRIKKIQRQIEILRLEALKRSNQATKNRYIQQSLDTILNESNASFHKEITMSTPEAHTPEKEPVSIKLSSPNVSENKEAYSQNLEGQILFEQGRLASELLDIFPIDLVEDKTFHFTICGLMLPSVFAINHYDATQIGAALGFVAQVLVCLSKYLDVPLPYPITVFGSQSYITDNITRIKHGSNRFPLWTRGVLLYRVEYGLYLLHKDIEQLMNSLNLAVADLKQTLANLKNLLLVLYSKFKHEP